MIYKTKYLKGVGVHDLRDSMMMFFDEQTHDEPGMVIDNIAYMQEMKVARLNPQIPTVEFCCIITYSL